METQSCIENRVDATRVDADDLVNELIAATDFDVDESAESKWSAMIWFVQWAFGFTDIHMQSRFSFAIKQY